MLDWLLHHHLQRAAGWPPLDWLFAAASCRQHCLLCPLRRRLLLLVCRRRP
jgi:hypothetical protein